MITKLKTIVDARIILQPNNPVQRGFSCLHYHEFHAILLLSNGQRPYIDLSFKMPILLLLLLLLFLPLPRRPSVLFPISASASWLVSSRTRSRGYVDRWEYIRLFAWDRPWQRNSAAVQSPLSIVPP